MATITQAFHDFMLRLELTPAEQAEASRQHNELRDRIRGRLGGVQRDLIVGSYARRTAIRPLNDIDLFLVLDPQVHRDRHDKTPGHILDRLQSALRGCYERPGPAIRIQGRSVNIEFSGTGIGYDLIPAFALNSTSAADPDDMVYEIPDRERAAWIQTNPARHRRRCVEANERAGGMLNRLIKAAKHWNRSHREGNGDKPLRSFHLEAMCYEAFSTRPADERRGLHALFGHLASRVLTQCPDPAGLSPHIDAGIGPEHRQRVHHKLRAAELVTREAVRHEERGDDAAACRCWGAVLGEPFRS